MAELTGRKVLAITVSAFGVIIAVNVTLAWQAIATFPGLEVDNGYVASQTFDAEKKGGSWLREGWFFHAVGARRPVLRLRSQRAGGSQRSCSRTMDLALPVAVSSITLLNLVSLCVMRSGRRPLAWALRRRSTRG